MVIAVSEEHPQKAHSPIVFTPFAKVTSVSSSLSLKISTPEYTAELGISERMNVVVLMALKLGFGVKDLGDVVLLRAKFELNYNVFGYDVDSSIVVCILKSLSVVKSR
jgi:hypothetical protein